ncbi:sugar transporter SWEET1 isoform X1 [Vespa crabro]|uniref:sugar transporter SWEET1 isoform X1 n=1 Tax=Vespa crabro TaxID=7445 RepID=UPI001F007613|nr:sugar transporter SWEET1 isoform X1 [Vespa crabro]
MISTEIKDILATSASICTILQFLAGVLVCRKYIKNGTTGDSSSLAFITCYMSCSLWLRYGLLIGDSFIVFVNIFGTILQVCYVLIFMLYSVKKSVTLRQFAAATCFLAIIYFYVAYETNKEIAAKYIGLISCSVTILFFASPLVMLTHVLRIKNTESLPFPIILASLIVSCQWFLYGYLINDRFIQMPNLMGCILSAFQLSLFCLYPNKRVDQIPLV